MDLAVSCNGKDVMSAALIVPKYGRWVADVVISDELTTVPEDASIVLSGTTLVGTIDQSHSGTFVNHTRLRVVGGENLIQSTIPKKHYHNDAGVKRRIVCEDAIRDCGETAGTIDYSNERMDRDFVRYAGPASRTLELIGARWYFGLTDKLLNVHTRDEYDITGEYEVLDYNPLRRIVTISVDKPMTIGIGARITQRITGIVRTYCLNIAGAAIRISAWLE